MTNKSKSQELVNPIILLECEEKEELEPIEYIDHTCHNTPGDSTSDKNVIKIPRFDSGMSEVQIIFVDLVQKALVGQNVTTGPPMYKCMERVLKGVAKAEFTQQANLVGSDTVGNFTTLMATMTVHIFPVLAYQDQKRYMYKYLRKPKTMKLRTFTTRLIQLNNYLSYFPPDCVGQMFTALPHDEVKQILYHAMPNWWRKKLTKEGYNYLDRSIQEMSGFFETMVENLETPVPPPAVRSLTRKKKKKKSQKQKAVSFEHSNKDSSDDEKPSNRKKFCQYHGKCSHSMDECTILKALIKKAKPNKSKGFRKGGKKKYLKHEVNVLIEKMLKKAFNGRKKRKHELLTFEKMEVSGSKDSDQSLDDSDVSSKSDDS